MLRQSNAQGVFHITPKPGLPQVAIVHGVYVLPEYRGNGWGHNIMRDIEIALIRDNYDAAICTTSGDNHAMQACLEAAGWSLLTTFHNRKTDAPHQMWGFTITKSVQQ